jgi:peptidoglycan/xylan/chitin deacetylase (PgdA/CDA1 family)
VLRTAAVDTLIRKSAKAAALPLARPVTRGKAAVVLLYHKVGAGDREIDIPAAAFEQQLRHVAARERPVTLDECLARGGVAVTIDDGFADFYDNVLPVVVDCRVPVLLYLATGAVADNGERGPDALTWGQLEEAVSTGYVEIGAHTHTHANLGAASATVAETEMRRCKELIEDRLGVPCRHFAYPWSLASSEAEEVARQLFTTAALTWRTNRLGSIQPHRFGRTPILRSDGSFFFRAKLAGRLDGEAVVYKALRRGPWRSS